MAAIVRGTSPFDLQMYAHHFLSVFTWYSTLFFMNFTVAGACAILFVEISTVFVSLRWLLYTHKLHDTILMPINTVCSVITFLFGRTIYMWVLCGKYLWPLLINEFKTVDLRWWQVLLLVEQFIAVTLSAFLNTYWMWLIVKQASRVVQRLMGLQRQESGRPDMEEQKEPEAEKLLNNEEKEVKDDFTVSDT